jgi:BlaI family penicillinase repressor
MARRSHVHLTRRERQIMDVVYRRGRASTGEVRAELPDPPGYSAVRALLRILEQKGHLRHERQGQRYVFLPTVPRERARRSALDRLVRTFFAGSPGDVLAALLDTQAKLQPEELDRLATLIERAKKEER